MGVIADRLRQIEKELNNKTLKVGFLETSRYKDGTPLAYVAAIQEYGSVGKNHNIPARPYFRPAIKKHKQEWIDKFKSEFERLDSGYDIFKSLGEVIQLDIQVSIADVHEPPLSKITLAMRYLRNKDREGFKGSKGLVEKLRRQLESDNPPKLANNTKPLNDSGYMFANVLFTIE